MIDNRYTGSIVLLVSILSFFTPNTDVWAIERSPYIYGLICAIAGLGILVWQRKKLVLDLGLIDILFVTYFVYTVFTSLIIRGELPQESKTYPIYGYLICYFIFQFFVKDPKNITITLKSLFWLVFVQALYGSLQYFYVFSPVGSSFRITGLYLNPGIFAALIICGLPIGIYQLKTNYQKKHFFYLYCFALAILVLALIVSKSRTALISGLFGLSGTIYFLFMEKVNSIFTAYKRIVLPTLACLILIGGFYIVQTNTASITGRFLIWKVSLLMILDHPLLGLGLGQFPIQYGSYQANFFKTHGFDPAAVNVAGMSYYPFNELLRIQIESGIIGLILYLSVITYSIVYIFRSIIKAKNLLLVPVLAVIISLLIFAQSSYPFEQNSISLIFICMISIASVMEKQIRSKRLIRLNLKMISTSVVSLLLILVGYGSLNKIRAINTWKMAQQNLLFKEKYSFDQYRSIYPILCEDGPFLFNYGAELFNAGFYEKSIPILNRASKYGNHFDLHLYFGDAYLALKEYRLAESKYQLAHLMVPNLFMPMDRLLKLYVETGQNKKALITAKIITHKHIKVPSKEIEEIIIRAQLFINNN